MDVTTALETTSMIGKEQMNSRTQIDHLHTCGPLQLPTPLALAQSVHPWVSQGCLGRPDHIAKFGYRRVGNAERPPCPPYIYRLASRTSTPPDSRLAQLLGGCGRCQARKEYVCGTRLTELLRCVGDRARRSAGGCERCARGHPSHVHATQTGTWLRKRQRGAARMY